MELKLRYNKPAEDSEEGWERESLPIGCGWLGANVFSIPSRERVQVTENSLVNDWWSGGLNNLAEIYIETEHNDYENYSRELSLDEAVVRCNYTSGGVSFSREYFASYPNRALVMRLKADKPALSCKISLIVPYVKDYNERPGDGYGKHGTVVREGDTLVMNGVLEYHNVVFSSRLKLITDGNYSGDADTLSVKNATVIELRFTCATNYRVRPEAFSEQDVKKKTDTSIDPTELAKGFMQKIDSLTYGEMLEAHKADYRELFGRVNFELDGAVSELYTDEMLKRYGEGERSPYLEILYFQYGRYLLISSSRKGTLPANLQGVWNCHDHSPWGSGYWHNINVQMNYWPAFSTNIAETFDAYADFNAAFRPMSAQCARDYLLGSIPHDKLAKALRRADPSLPEDIDPKEYLLSVPNDEIESVCGWIVGTMVYPYLTTGPGVHSGPGTGALTTKLFADRYYFTRDREKLMSYDLPVLASMSRFLTKSVDNYDGEYLSVFSASPEQYTAEGYYLTVGCSFDQQMLYENGYDFLELAKAAGVENIDTEIQREQIDKYSPVLVGKSGQIKEYREENFYGEIGEYKHRHISQLVAVFPGRLINRSTPAWMDAVKYTLNERGDESKGWALAHRLCSWARTGDGNRAYKLLSNLIGKRTLPNLWDLHPPFQIDGNLGGCAGIAEMLLQSHMGAVEILPALPDAWASGSVSGLAARGNFEVSIRWSNGIADEIRIKSKSAEPCRVIYPTIERARLDGAVNFKRGDDFIEFDTELGKEYVIYDIPRHKRTDPVSELTFADGLLSWGEVDSAEYSVSYAVDNDPAYTPMAHSLTVTEYTPSLPTARDHITLRVTARRQGELESHGKTLTIAL